jgi:hypothetical protein
LRAGAGYDRTRSGDDNSSALLLFVQAAVTGSEIPGVRAALLYEGANAEIASARFERGKDDGCASTTNGKVRIS